jgi:MFS transporter, ACS family, tartrate transporter
MGDSRMNDDRVFITCAWRLIPFMMLLYVVNYLDRVNVGFAALTMNADLGLTPTGFGFGATAFFASYILLQVPASVALERLSAPRAIFCMLTVWGAISASTALVRGPLSFAAVRFLLGAAEAGFFPVLMVYLSLWFPRSYRTRFTAVFMSSIPLAYVIGAPVSGLILGMGDVGMLSGWQWLFLIEGLPACLLGVAALLVLPSGPAGARWLDADEKALIAARVQREDIALHREVGPALCDPRVWALGIVNFGFLFATYGVQLWLPQIVQGFGFSVRTTGFVVAAPFLMGVAVMIAWGRSSDLKDERVRHIALPAMLAAAGFIAASLAPNDGVALVALSLASISVLAMAPAFFSLLASFLSGPAAAGGIALVISLSNIGSFLGPSLVGVIKQQTGSYAPAMALFAGFLLLAAVTILAVGRSLASGAGMPESAS